ncbi:MAG: UDP-3-O-(3-hydroxymyristoyl)glucosamine N-acyltransferase [Desulfofustis sp.]|nr:UDP-3-O-(3-hydroxymyristoyl)glucosamine N-acyltransferase [Desulfofustis sp.]
MKNTMSLRELALLVEGDIVGDQDLQIHGFGPLESAGPGEMSFLVKAGKTELIEKSSASAFLVPESVTVSAKTIVRVKDPYLASALIQNHLLKKTFEPRGISARASVGDGCTIPEAVSIGPMVVLGDRVRIGERVEIGPGTVIGDEVTIGDDCIIKPNVSIAQRCEIGCRVIIHPGTVIGSDGYGYATDKRGYHVKRPQLGIVRIDDDVEIGANCCIDRATFGVTWIKSGAKIDNLVQVAHNVIVGENSLLVAQVGISGSVTLGRNVVFGGQAGAAGHQTIGDGTMVAGKSAVHGDKPAGSRLSGVPAIEAGQWFKAATAFTKLPEILRDVRKLKKDLARILEQEAKES